jgi:hypothetical protein
VSRLQTVSDVARVTDAGSGFEFARPGSLSAEELRIAAIQVSWPLSEPDALVQSLVTSLSSRQQQRRRSTHVTGKFPGGRREEGGSDGKRTSAIAVSNGPLLLGVPTEKLRTMDSRSPAFRPEGGSQPRFGEKFERKIWVL